MKTGSKLGKLALSAGLSVLLCVPIALPTLAACGGGEVEQAAVKNSEDIGFTPLGSVTVTDPYAVNALDKELTYLVDTLDADRLLYYFHENAGLTPKAASGYGGDWEGRLIGGHTMGHYLTALAQAYANAGTSAERKAEVKEKLDYILEELQRCQNNAEAAGAQAGFIWGAPKPAYPVNGTVEAQFDNVENNMANIETQAWVPWYTMHKILAGLIDAWQLTGSETAKSVAIALGDWTYGRVSKWTEAKQRTVLGIEYGGMNDALYNLYAATGEEKYAEAAHKFDEEELFLSVRTRGSSDYLAGKHANTTIPKIIGALNRYLTLKDTGLAGNDIEDYLETAEEFWDYVIEHHTYVTGGNSDNEHFVSMDKLDAHRTNINCETCNTYNMLKLSRMLFSVTKDKKYLDYYENTYYNAIWSSQNPETGMTMYFQPMATGYFKVYSTPENNFWCCTGSGMESMSKLNDSIYYPAGNATYVSLYLKSVYTSEEVSLEQDADLEHSDEATIKVTAGKTVLRLRRPYWSEEFAVKVNGKPVSATGRESFVSVSVKKGDEVTVTMKKTARAYDLPDAENTYAILYGPFVLSADLGGEKMQTTGHGAFGSVTKPAAAVGDVRCSVDATSVSDFMEHIGEHLIKGENDTFLLECNNVTLTYSYHFRQYKHRYGIYFDFTTERVEKEIPDYEWVENLGGGSSIRAGYGQDENGYKESAAGATESSSSAETYGTFRRAKAGGWFSYDMPVAAGEVNRLLVNFAKADNGKSIKITVGGTQLYAKTLSYSGTDAMYEEAIELPASVVNAAEDGYVTVRFESNNTADAAMICGTIYMQHLENNMLYFVDCGDYSPNTVNEGDYFGAYNSVTDQVYGEDPVTGKKWGILDENASTGQGACPNGVYTQSTWAYEYGADGDDKTVTNRYTKNQYESGWQQAKLAYKFDLDDGEYLVRFYLADPWSCSKNVDVSANGTRMVTDAACGRAISFRVAVTGGSLTLDFTSDLNDADKCINLSYIIILPA